MAHLWLLRKLSRKSLTPESDKEAQLLGWERKAALGLTVGSGGGGSPKGQH